MSLDYNDCPNCLGMRVSDIFEKMDQYKNLPYLNLTSPITNIPHPTNLDVDLNMPTDQNFNYYCVHDLHSSHDIAECSSGKMSFSALHCNIRSLSSNQDNFLHMLASFNFSFSLIGLTETKIRADENPIMNVNIPGYNFVSEPSLSNAGGVAFYIRDNLNFSLRTDLTVSNLDCDALWIEILTHGQPNVLCGVTYRHPNGNIDNFMNYINSKVSKIHLEEKMSLIMGDFNIDLLKTNSLSDNFLNTLGSLFFQPQILQPTRITDHSATLIIDNIFFNSIEHFVISGNLI